MSNKVRIDKTGKATKTVAWAFVVLCTLLLSVCTLAVQSKSASRPPQSLLTPTAAAGDPRPVIGYVCSNIYKGDFAAARRAIGTSDRSGSTAVTELADIIAEYERIKQQRLAARNAGYEDQLEKLKKLQNPSDANEAKDANDLTKVLSAIVQLREFANDRQKKGRHTGIGSKNQQPSKAKGNILFTTDRRSLLCSYDDR